MAHLGDAHVDEVLLGEERERVHGDVLVLELPEVQPRQRHVQAAAADLRVQDHEPVFHRERLRHAQVVRRPPEWSSIVAVPSRVYVLFAVRSQDSESILLWARLSSQLFPSGLLLL